jgi:hypothetical protein
MFHQPSSKMGAEAESLGVTRLFGRTFVVAGQAFATLAAAIDQGRRLQGLAVAL